MRELTIDEMEQVSGGVFAAGVAAGCGTGAISQDNGVLGGIMGCAGGTASSLALAMAPFTGPLGAVALVGVAIGIGYATYQAQEYFDGRKPVPVIPYGS